MTILQIILYWVISEVIAWGLWYFTVNRVVRSKVKNEMATILLISQRLGAYPSTQNKTTEWLRFIIWPYGIIQRTMVVNRVCKEVMSD